ncbi:hypothetical protein AB7M35_001483 [Amorphus suaedae]
MIDRRLFLNGLVIFGAAGLGLVSRGHALDIAAMKPGEFFWDLDRAPAGPMVIIVSLPAQRLYVYRAGELVAVSTTSTGKPGHETPTGVFTILQKDKDHHSSIYNNASMPFTERLTWSGVALHAGNLPGYPTSHGCVHLPLAFAKDLFGITPLGTPVIIADSHSGPADVLHPGLLLPADAESEAVAETIMTDGDTAAVPAGASTATPAAVIASAADGRIYVMENGTLTFDGPITVADGPPIGNTLYVMKAQGTDGPPAWVAVRYETAAGSQTPEAPSSDPLHRISADANVRQRLASLFVAGSTLLVTEDPAHPGTRSDPGFVVATHDMV